MSKPTATSILNLKPGDTIRVVGFHDIPESWGYGTTLGLDTGTIRKSSPVVTVAAIENAAYHSRGLRTVILVLADGRRINCSTRQRVHVITAPTTTD